VPFDGLLVEPTALSRLVADDLAVDERRGARQGTDRGEFHANVTRVVHLFG
jgi:hypothetical protein